MPHAVNLVTAGSRALTKNHRNRGLGTHMRLLGFLWVL
jgi:hypothetical protein